ncbi:MAG: hypothetical protein HDS59_05090 [Barnesiella sp.]|nr:hypothetical protein [Barnesiella sp.]
MKLKIKIAQLLRKWADQLCPILPYDANPSYFQEVQYDVQRAMCQYSLPKYLYEQDPDRSDRVIREEIAHEIAKELDARHLIKIQIEPTSKTVVYIGELNVITHRTTQFTN